MTIIEFSKLNYARWCIKTGNKTLLERSAYALFLKQFKILLNDIHPLGR